MIPVSWYQSREKSSATGLYRLVLPANSSGRSTCLPLVGIMVSPRFLFSFAISPARIRYVFTLISFFLLWSVGFVKCTIWFSYCIIYTYSFLFSFRPGVISHSRVIGACPVTNEYLVALSECENNCVLLQESRAFELHYSLQCTKYHLCRGFVNT